MKNELIVLFYRCRKRRSSRGSISPSRELDILSIAVSFPRLGTGWLAIIRRQSISVQLNQLFPLMATLCFYTPRNGFYPSETAHSGSQQQEVAGFGPKRVSFVRTNEMSYCQFNMYTHSPDVRIGVNVDLVKLILKQLIMVLFGDVLYYFISNKTRQQR